MITAYVKTLGRSVEVDGLANRGEWFGETWLVGIGMGFECLMLVVEAGSEQDAIDALVDSGRWNHILLAEDDEDYDEDYANYAGNNGERLDPNLEIRFLERVKVNYFAKPE